MKAERYVINEQYKKDAPNLGASRAHSYDAVQARGKVTEL